MSRLRVDVLKNSVTAVASKEGEFDTSTTTEAVHSFVAATDVILEWYYDGTNVYAYVNGDLAATIAASNANFPNDEYMTPTIDFTTGSGDARTCQIDWLRAIQVQAT